MASLDNLEGDATEGIGLIILLVILLAVFFAYTASRGLGTKVATAYNNFAGNVSSGLYNVGQSGTLGSMFNNTVSGPLNSVLADISMWADEFYNPSYYSGGSGNGSTDTVTAGADATNTENAQ